MSRRKEENNSLMWKEKSKATRPVKETTEVYVFIPCLHLQLMKKKRRRKKKEGKKLLKALLKNEFHNLMKINNQYKNIFANEINCKYITCTQQSIVVLIARKRRTTTKLTSFWGTPSHKSLGLVLFFSSQRFPISLWSLNALVYQSPLLSQSNRHLRGSSSRVLPPSSPFFSPSEFLRHVTPSCPSMLCLPCSWCCTSKVFLSFLCSFRSPLGLCTFSDYRWILIRRTLNFGSWTNLTNLNIELTNTHAYWFFEFGWGTRSFLEWHYFGVWFNINLSLYLLLAG